MIVKIDVRCCGNCANCQSRETGEPKHYCREWELSVSVNNVCEWWRAE